MRTSTDSLPGRGWSGWSIRLRATGISTAGALTSSRFPAGSGVTLGWPMASPARIAARSSAGQRDWSASIVLIVEASTFASE